MSNNIFLYHPQKKELMAFGENRMPVQVTQTNLEWAIWGDMEDWENQQPQYYEYLSRMSSKNNSILNAKNRYVYGKGLAVKDDKMMTNQQKVAINSFVRKLNKSKVVRKLIADGNKFNGFACEVIFDVKGEKIMPHYIPFQNVRVSKDEYDDSNKLLPKKYFYTKDWSKGRTSKDNKDFVVFEPFEWDAEKYDKSKRYLVYWKGDGYEDSYYPEPDYLGGVPYIDADCEVGNFTKNNTKNGFTGGYMVNFYNGEPTPDQKKDIKEQFDKVLHGTDNAGKSVKSFNENNGKGVEITPLSDNGQDDRFINLNNQIRDEIFTAHGISPLVVGMKTESGWSNQADEKRTAIEAYIVDGAEPKQEVYNELVNSIIDFNQLVGDAYLQRLPPIKEQVSVEILKEIATIDEMREIAGLPKSKAESNPVTDAINSLSPLVANKVLESMTLGEIRSLIGLVTDNPAITTTRTITEEFSDEDANLLQCFAEIGTDDKEFSFHGSRQVKFADCFEAKRQGDSFVMEFANRMENAILKMLADKPELTVKQLAELLKETPKTVSGIIETLNNNGLLDGQTVTEKGAEEIKDNEIFVVYKYAIRSDAPPLVKGGKSREFCIKMREMSKTRSWTIEQIQEISNRVGYDVFSRRGGFYHNPKTGNTTPYCRDIFEQRLVRRK